MELSLERIPSCEVSPFICIISKGSGCSIEKKRDDRGNRGIDKLERRRSFRELVNGNGKRTLVTKPVKPVQV